MKRQPDFTMGQIRKNMLGNEKTTYRTMGFQTEGYFDGMGFILK